MAYGHQNNFHLIDFQIILPSKFQILNKKWDYKKGGKMIDSDGDNKIFEFKVSFFGQKIITPNIVIWTVTWSVLMRQIQWYKWKTFLKINDDCLTKKVG